MIVDVFAELFSSLIDLAVVHHQIAVVVSCPCVLIDCFCNCNSCLFVALAISLTMEGLLEVVKAFVDPHGRSKSRVKSIYFMYDLLSNVT